MQIELPVWWYFTGVEQPSIHILTQWDIDVTCFPLCCTGRHSALALLTVMASIAVAVPNWLGQRRFGDGGTRPRAYAWRYGYAAGGISLSEIEIPGF